MLKLPSHFTIGPTGRLVTTTEAVSPSDAVNAAISFSVAGAVKVVDAIPEVFANGLGFYEGALCTTSGPADTFNSGIPFTFQGMLVTDPTGPITKFESGWPLTANGVAVTVAGLAPAVSYELREDGGFELREDGGRELRER